MRRLIAAIIVSVGITGEAAGQELRPTLPTTEVKVVELIEHTGRGWYYRTDAGTVILSTTKLKGVPSLDKHPKFNALRRHCQKLQPIVTVGSGLLQGAGSLAQILILALGR